MYFVAVFDKFESQGRNQFRRFRLAEFNAKNDTEALSKAREMNEHNDDFKGWQLIRLIAVAYEIGTKGAVAGFVMQR